MQVLVGLLVGMVKFGKLQMEELLGVLKPAVHQITFGMFILQMRILDGL